MPKHPHINAANKYIRHVLSGKIPACKWVKAACKRQHDDLERWKGKSGPYYFDKAAAERVCWFISRLPHVKGEWAKRHESIRLEPWQCFILTTVFGWKRTADRLRRFRIVYNEIPRKNSKSTLSSGVGLYMLTEDQEQGAEIYSAATSRDQARIVFADAQAMARKEPEFRRKYGVDVAAHAIYRVGTASRFQALSSDSDTLEGLNVHCGIIDELHAHKSRRVYDVIETATGARSQPLIWNITTAGSDRAGICYEVRTYLTKILNGVVRDDTFFGCIWTIDDESKWMEPASWKAANPNYAISIYPDDFERLAKKAMETPSATNNFLTKRLNIWVSADAAWMDMAAWDRCGDPSLSLDDFAGEPCWMALDLASTRDITAKSLLFRRDIDGKAHYYGFGRYYLPEQSAEDGRNSQYSGWAREGRLVLTPGNATDFEYLKLDMREDAKKFQIIEAPFDQHQAHQLSMEMLSEGIPMVKTAMNVLTLSEPMKELEKAVLQGRFHHDGCPALAWMASNVVCHYDVKDNIYPRKEKEENKIDGIVTLIMAIGRAMVPTEPEKSAYEDPNHKVPVF